MIKRVRRQFVAITMTMLTTVLLVPLIALNIVVSAVSYNQTANLLEQIAISEVTSWNREHNLPDEPPNSHQNNNNDVPEKDDNGNNNDDNNDNDNDKTETDTTVTDTTNTAHTTTVATKSKQSGNQSRTTQSASEASADQQTSQRTEAAGTSAQQTTAAAKETKVTEKPKETEAVQNTPPKAREDSDYEVEEPYHFWAEPQTFFVLSSKTAAVTTTPVTTTTATTATTTKGTETSKTTTKTTQEKKAESPSGNSSTTIDHFLCFLDTDGIVTNLDGTSDYTESDVQLMADNILAEGKTDGYYGNLQYFRKDADAGTLLVFADRSSERLMMRMILLISVFTFFIMEIVVLVLTIFFTKRAMQPIHATFERQRQFISDAGHELKTPLTIISANADILQDEIGENKWLQYIHAQTERMRVLITDMMNLTRLDSVEKHAVSQFSLSAAVSGAALPFESQAFEQHKKLELHIQDHISYTGNVDEIKQLVGIFIDNAIKYSNEKGEIRVTLSQVKDKKTLKFYNTGIGVTDEEKERIFERFYRSDSSRTRATGGYGLGLSIAKSIADSHKIKIQIESEYQQWVCFTLIF